MSPSGFAFDDADTVLAEAERAAAIAHDHPKGIQGPQATALAVLRARRAAPPSGSGTSSPGASATTSSAASTPSARTTAST